MLGKEEMFIIVGATILILFLFVFLFIYFLKIFNKNKPTNKKIIADNSQGAKA